MSASLPWPTITSTPLLERWRAPDDELVHHLAPLLELVAGRLPPNTIPRTPELAYAYPYGRAAGAVRLDDGVVAPISPEEAATLRADRWPILAIGANGSPDRLAKKLTALSDRCAILTPATVTGIDICACPVPAAYGSLPAGIAASPGTTVDAVVADHTTEQVEWLAITEFGYRLVRLTGATVQVADGRVIEAPLAFVQRLGLYGIDGHPVPLAAIGGRGRRWAARTQRELIADCAQRVGMPAPDPDSLLADLLPDPPAWMDRHSDTLMAQALRGFEPPHVAFPA